MPAKRKQYSHRAVEKKWQRVWQKERIYEPDVKRAKKPFYNLMMFPYPSAEGLHVGNMYAFTGTDIFGRFKRMQGYDVLEPIGLDGFGIHSENYALKIGAHPVTQAKVSEKRFYAQLQSTGNGFAWSRRLETYDPAYYRFTQWLFIQMFKSGLAYRKKQLVNWCPSCKTVLADEQVEKGKCERCASVVTKKELEQWFFKITQYADRLLKNTTSLDWSEKVRVAQQNWIGKSEGARISFAIPAAAVSLEVFTTRPDTLYGVTYLALAPEHPALPKLIAHSSNKGSVEKYIAGVAARRSKAGRSEKKEKTGVQLSGVFATNPATKEKITVWVSDYVLPQYGTGAIMAVPAHDQRDFDFARQFNVPIRQVIKPVFGLNNKRADAVSRDTISAVVRRASDGKILMLKWKHYPWTTPVIGGIEIGEDVGVAAVREVLEETGYRTRVSFVSPIILDAHFFAEHKNEWRARIDRSVLLDLIDETPESVSSIEANLHEAVWMDAAQALKEATFTNNKLAIELALYQRPYEGGWPGAKDTLVNSNQFDGMDAELAKEKITAFAGGKFEIHYHLRDWLISRQRYWGAPIPMIFCSSCAAQGIGEREDMPGWYTVSENKLPVKLPFVEDFRPQGTGKSPLASVKSFYTVRCPSCGSLARRETDVSDTFLDSAWYFLRYPSVQEKNKAWDASITKRWLPVDMYIGGAEHSVLHLLYSRFVCMALKDMGYISFEEPFTTFRAHGLLIKEGAKMSKSKGNVVNPDAIITEFGADTLRMYLVFLAPFEEGGDYQDKGILGISRFLERVWKYALQCADERRRAKISPEGILHEVHKTLRKVTDDIQTLHYNTAISALMILLNVFERESESVALSEFELFLKMVAPFAPHMTEEIWRNVLGHSASIHLQTWPQYNPKLVQSTQMTIVVQVNGKVKGTLIVPAHSSEVHVKERAFKLDVVERQVQGGQVKKVIYVPGRVINIIL